MTPSQRFVMVGECGTKKAACATPGTASRARRSTPARLNELALAYVGRFATTRAKLRDYLQRKVRERGWDGAAAPDSRHGRALRRDGYVDDEAYALSKSRSLTGRGYGAAAGRAVAARRGGRGGGCRAGARACRGRIASKPRCASPSGGGSARSPAEPPTARPRAGDRGDDPRRARVRPGPGDRRRCRTASAVDTAGVGRGARLTAIKVGFPTANPC